MTDEARGVERVYLTLTLLSTLAASLIWGVNTLFLLDAGLSNFQAFTANAFFTVGQVAFEIPTGVVADIWGRRTSYLLGATTLLVSTLLYLLMWRIGAPLWGWAIASVLLGLGFTFFSGATEAWLVDALKASGYDESLEAVFAKAQTVSGVAMLVGTLAGGLIAQLGNLGLPYIVRSVLLGMTLLVAFLKMKDLGFAPDRSKRPLAEVRAVLRASLDHGWRNPPVRWVMLSAPFTMGVSLYGFYALQPHLLDLWGDKQAFAIGGLTAAIIAATEIVGGLSVRYVRRIFTRRTQVLIVMSIVSVACMAALGWTRSFWVAIAVVAIWGTAFAASMPMRQAYVNGLIPSAQRATVLSFDNLMGSAGGVVTQPALGRAADAWGYPVSYLIGAAIHVAAVPFLALARGTRAASDVIERSATPPLTSRDNPD